MLTGSVAHAGEPACESDVRRVRLGPPGPGVRVNGGAIKTLNLVTVVLVLVRGSKHTWLGIQRRKRRALVRMESLAG
jgi:hypothetical protein